MCKDRSLSDSEVIAAAGLPEIPPEFREEWFDHEWQSDGLTLAYQRTEVEFEYRPPDIAAGASVRTHLENKAANAATFGTAVVEVKGNVNAKRSALVDLANVMALETSDSFTPDGDDSLAPILAYSIDGTTARNDVTIVISFLTDIKKVTDAKGVFRANVFSKPPKGFKPYGSGAYPIAKPSPDRELLRPPFQEPCEDFVKVADTSKFFLAGQLAGAAALQSQQTPPATPATKGDLNLENILKGIQGIGGLQLGASTGTSTAANIYGIHIYDPASQIAAGGVLGIPPPSLTTPAGGAVPFGGVGGFQTTDVFIPPGGGVTGTLESTIGGGNKVAGGTLQADAPDPADRPETYTWFNCTVIDDYSSGQRVVRHGGATDPATGKLYPNPVFGFGSPTNTRTIRWTASRFGFPPQEPDPHPPAGDDNFKYQDGHVERDNPKKSDSGHLEFVVVGWFTYGVRRPWELTTSYPLAPFLVRQVKKEFPNGLPVPSVAKDLIWWAMRKAPPHPMYQDQDVPDGPVSITVNGVQMPTENSFADPLSQFRFTIPPYTANPGG